MLKMLAFVGVAVVVLAAAVLVLAATRTDSFRVQRATTIKAPPEKVFALINDLHRWESWSPWEKKDPAMRRSHSGPASGAGAAYAWEGDRNVGKGRMTIAESSPPSRVSLRLDFVAPFEAHNIVDFTLEPEGEDSTTVLWAMHGPTPYFAKIIHLFVSMEKMVGRDFEAGLADLKAVAER